MIQLSHVLFNKDSSSSYHFVRNVEVSTLESLIQKSHRLKFQTKSKLDVLIN